MDNEWKIRLTLDRVESGYRGCLLTYRDLPDVREEKVELFMVATREEAVEIASQAAARLGLPKFGLNDRTKQEGPIRDNSAMNAMQMERRMLNIPILHIDTNLINARQKLAAINQMEKWAADEVILINMSGTAHVEAQADGNPARVRKANQQIFTDTPVERDALYHRIAEVLFPQGTKTQNQENDVSIVHEAAKYHAILVTSDGASNSQPGGILGNRDKLRDYVRIFSPEEAVGFVQDKIRERDEFNARVAQEGGGDVPEWTGKD